jgi:hypothetical protein
MSCHIGDAAAACCFRLGNYLFSLFNDQSRHFLTHNQLTSLVTSTLDRLADPPAAKRLAKLVPRLPAEVTHAVFHSFLADHPAVLLPLSDLQAKLRGKCFGVKFWKRKQALRLRCKEQMAADFLEQLDRVNEELYAKRERAAEVEARMAEWRQHRDAQVCVCGGGY